MPGFPRTHRLTNKRDFQWVFAEPHKIASHYLLALYRSNTLGHARLGIIINKHYVKRAVDRNQWRRIIRESFRQHQQALVNSSQEGLDVIVLIRSECGGRLSSVLINKTIVRDDSDYLWQRLTNSFQPS